MTNKEKYIKVFAEVLNISNEQVNEELKLHSVSSWDSIGHMSLISAFEDTFDIFIDTEDILVFNSFCSGIEILKKYDIEI